MKIIPDKVSDILDSFVVHHTNKHRMPGYTFFQTVPMLTGTGHVLQRDASKMYVLCLSNNDGVRYDKDGFVFGYTRPDLASMSALINQLNCAVPYVVSAKGRMRPTEYSKGSNLVLPGDYTTPFEQRVNGAALRNNKTGVELELTGKSKSDIKLATGLKSYALDRLLYDGACRSGWVLVRVGQLSNS